MLSTFISSTIRTSSSFGASPSSLSNSVAKEAARVSSTITRSQTDFLVPAKRSDPDTKAVKGRPDFEDRVFDHWAEKKIRGRNSRAGELRINYGPKLGESAL